MCYKDTNNHLVRAMRVALKRVMNITSYIAYLLWQACKRFGLCHRGGGKGQKCEDRLLRTECPQAEGVRGQAFASAPHAHKLAFCLMCLRVLVQVLKWSNQLAGFHIKKSNPRSVVSLAIFRISRDLFHSHLSSPVTSWIDFAPMFLHIVHAVSSLAISEIPLRPRE